MAQLPSVKVPLNQWIDVYSETGITPGTKVIVQNIGSDECWLVDSASEPNITSTGRNLIKNNQYLTSSDSPDGVWAFSETGTTLQVEVSA